MLQHFSLTSIRLFTFLGVFFCGYILSLLFLTPTAFADTVYYPVPSVIMVASSSSSTIGILKVQMPTQPEVEELAGGSALRQDLKFWKQLPTTITATGINNLKCKGGVSGSGSWNFGNFDLSTIDSTDYFKDDTATGYADCSGAGVYYATYRDLTYSTSTVAWVAPYYWSGSFTDSTTTPSGSSTTTTECTTCTRIISTNPEQGDSIASTTSSQLLFINYYLNGEDYDAGDTYFNIRVTQQQQQTCAIFGSFLCSEINETIYQDIPIYWGTNSTNIVVRNLTATGTYEIAISAFKDGLLFDKPIPLNGPAQFFITVGTTTASLTKTPPPFGDGGQSFFSVIYGGVDCEIDFLTSTSDSFACIFEYMWRTLVPETSQLAQLAINQKDAIFQTEPWGSMLQLVSILFDETTATGTMSMTYNFNLAGQTQTFTLDAGAGLQQAMTYISTQEVDTIDGNPYDKFLEYWELLWYIVFGLWLISTLIGEFGYDYGREHESVWSRKLEQGRNIRTSQKWTRHEHYNPDSGRIKTRYSRHKKL